MSVLNIFCLCFEYKISPVRLLSKYVTGIYMKAWNIDPTKCAYDRTYVFKLIYQTNAE